MSDDRAIKAVREVLESMLPRALARSAMAEALSEAEGPATAESLHQLVHGQLQSNLSGRIPDEVRDALMARLNQIVGPSQVGTRPRATIPDNPETARLFATHPETRTGARATDLELKIDSEIPMDFEHDPQATERLQFAGRRSVPVVAVAATESLERSLRGELRQSFSCRTVRSDAELRKAAFSDAPLLVIVDASDPPRSDVRALAIAIQKLPNNVVTVIWGSERRFGTTLLAALEGTKARLVRVPKSEGLDPLLDLIASRRDQPG